MHDLWLRLYRRVTIRSPTLSRTVSASLASVTIVAVVAVIAVVLVLFWRYTNANIHFLVCRPWFLIAINGRLSTYGWIPTNGKQSSAKLE